MRPRIMVPILAGLQTHGVFFEEFMKITNYDEVMEAIETVRNLEYEIGKFYVQKYVGKTLTLRTPPKKRSGEFVADKITWTIEPVYRKEILCTLYGKHRTKGGKVCKALHIYPEAAFLEFEDHYKTKNDGSLKC